MTRINDPSFRLRGEHECRIAIDEFVDLQIGIALPLAAQGQIEWTVVGNGRTGNGGPGSWGGHGIPSQAYAQEAHVLVTKEMLNKTGVGPSGVAWDKLIADINVLASAPEVKPGVGTTEAAI